MAPLSVQCSVDQLYSVTLDETGNPSDSHYLNSIIIPQYQNRLKRTYPFAILPTLAKLRAIRILADGRTDVMTSQSYQQLVKDLMLTLTDLTEVSFFRTVVSIVNVLTALTRSR